jgi:FkbM family methyltransferase
LLLYYLGTFEPHCLDVMRRHIEIGNTLLDVGANIGLFSIEACISVGATGKVIAIEAAPRHAETLKQSAMANNFHQIEVVACAASDGEGRAVLSLPQGGNHGMFTLGDIKGCDTVNVTTRTIDDIVGSRRIDFIKMDIEGSELHALRGAINTICRSQPPILIELNERALAGCGSSSREVKEFLFALGYKGQIIGGGTIQLDTIHDCDECLFILA